MRKLLPSYRSRRSSEWLLTPQLDTIRVYFNDDNLDPASAINPNFYQLVFTNDSVQPNDDVSLHSEHSDYDPVADMATLRFSARIDQLGGAGTYRLRVGSSTVVNSASNLPVVPLVLPAADPTGFLEPPHRSMLISKRFCEGSMKPDQHQ